MKTALIITGGYICYKKIKIDVTDYSIVIAADSGYLAADKLNITPDIIIGDFDSAVYPNKSASIITAPTEKDETDTMLACSKAIELGADKITIVGGTGGRADHFLSNLFLLEGLREKGISALLTDGENTLKIISDETTEIINRGGYFSLFALDSCNVSISGCKYPLENYTLTRSNPFAVSNEVVAREATVTVRGKAVLCMCDKQ